MTIQKRKLLIFRENFQENHKKSFSPQGEKLIFLWCGGGDSNSHSLAATRSLALRVYRFRHPRATSDIIIALLKRVNRGKLKFSSLFDSSGFAASFPEIVKLGTPDLTEALYFDFINRRAMKGENPFHTHTTGHLSYSESLAQSAMFPGDNNTLKNLKTLSGTFLDLHMHSHCVPGPEIRDVIFQILFFHET